MWPYPWTHVGTPSHLGHMDRLAATMPSQAHAGAAQEAPDIGQWEGQDVPLVRPSICNVKGGIPSSRRYLPTYLLTTRRHQLQEWHAHRIAAAAQERERYGRNDTPYKSLRYVSRILEDTGRRTIHGVRTPEGGLTNDPEAILQAVLDSFQAQHGEALPDLEPHT